MTKLLIVDDEPNVLRSLALALRMEGFEVASAPSAKDALELVADVDLVLTDMSMPEADGLFLLREIRKQRPFLPVAIMTAHASVDGALRAMQEGAYDYLLKPCQTDEIVLKVKLGLKLSRYEHELRAQNAELARTKRELEIANADLESANDRLEAANIQLETTNVRLEEANLELKRLATTDALTGIANRRHFIERLRHETANSRRYGHPLSLILLDIDHFKRVNDTHGHPAGDSVLKQLASVLIERSRETDLPARIGGEEFAILLPSTKTDGARELAESVRARISSSRFEAVGNVTASLGVALYDPFHERSAADPNGEKLLIAADEALYRAKRLGRNRVEES